MKYQRTQNTCIQSRLRCLPIPKTERLREYTNSYATKTSNKHKKNMRQGLD